MLLSGCIIAKNEENVIANCLGSMSSLVDEIILVDTGSEDKTITIAKTFNAKIFHYKWNYDFSKVRNFALKQAHGKWILFLDADETINTNNHWLKKKLQIEEKDALLANLINKGYQTVDNLFRESVIRIFKNNQNISYKRSIHEYLAKNNIPLTYSNCRKEITIYHQGYLLNNFSKNNKYKRYISMLLQELKNEPNNSEIHYFLAETHLQANDVSKSMFHLESALTHNNFRNPLYYRLTIIRKTLLLLNNNRCDLESLLLIIKEYLNILPDCAELQACLGIIMHKMGQNDKANYLLKKSLDTAFLNQQLVSYYDEVYPQVMNILYI